MKNTRLQPKIRCNHILDAALKASEKHHYLHVTRKQIADMAGCAPSLVSNYFGTMQGLRKTIIRKAIDQNNLIVLLQGLVANDPRVCKLPKSVKRKILNTAKNK